MHFWWNAIRTSGRLQFFDNKMKNNYILVALTSNIVYLCTLRLLTGDSKQARTGSSCAAVARDYSQTDASVSLPKFNVHRKQFLLGAHLKYAVQYE